MNRPRILYLVPDLYGPPGGIARYCRMVCRALSETQVDLHVVALHDAANSSLADDLDLPTRFYVPCNGNKIRFVWESVRSARRRPHIVLVGHAHFSPLAWVLARCFGAQLVVFLYGVEVWETLPPLRRWTLQRADTWIAISQFTADRAVRSNDLPPARISLLPNCLDPRFETAEMPPSRHAGRSLITVARIAVANRYKGHREVIQALPRLLEPFPDLIYHVVGDGDDRPELEAWAHRQGVQSAVRFHGIVSDEELIKLYAEASVFIMPSRSEGFGFVFVEAMAQGTPAIGGTLDAAPEVIVDGETGYVVDPTSIEAIVDAASKLLADDHLRCRMGKAAHEHVAHTFSYDVFRERLLGYLELRR